MLVDLAKRATGWTSFLSPKNGFVGSVRNSCLDIAKTELAHTYLIPPTWRPVLGWRVGVGLLTPNLGTLASKPSSGTHTRPFKTSSFSYQNKIISQQEREETCTAGAENCVNPWNIVRVRGPSWSVGSVLVSQTLHRSPNMHKTEECVSDSGACLSKFPVMALLRLSEGHQQLSGLKTD